MLLNPDRAQMNVDRRFPQACISSNSNKSLKQHFLSLQFNILITIFTKLKSYEVSILGILIVSRSSATRVGVLINIILHD